ncbi:cysteine desulfurase family protein [Pseudomonas vanderleydeniana]|uniref:Aminotransferase class V-fold PLP-dependent enzyme n=1 Tax=Pseudomonas vanderleydeniana TaxID=2745495 RepID=A0A9E6PIH8_9PSED|nr:aminotransferase class V-fold PLP-dependent enzyme [Pseudomonas vanderleydeniana]QXI27050.1 aminotransferase class V-fold PLP-dependent enzyme [Pseudomonas vanderleydeniana]
MTASMIYLDNAASALPFGDAVNFQVAPGNPSSDHPAGHAAKAILDRTRDQLSALFGGRPGEYYFCSGATEAANLIIQGHCQFLKATQSPRNQIIVSAIEHPAIFNTVKHMQQLGFGIDVVPVDRCGIIETSYLYDALSERTAMVLVMGVNNETGACQPVDEIARRVKMLDAQIPVICDGVQMLTKVAAPDLACVDAIIGSGHKLGAAKGIGFFFLSHRLRLFPLQLGGEQESGIRPGTENLYGIESLYRALRHHERNADGFQSHVRQLGTLLLETLARLHVAFSLNTQDGDTSGYVFSLRFAGLDASKAMKLLAQRNICVSKGSACSSVSPVPSRVLSAMKLTPAEMGSTLRVSFSPLSRPEEVLAFCEAIRSILSVEAKVVSG